MFILKAINANAGGTDDTKIGFGVSYTTQLISTQNLGVNSPENITTWTNKEKTIVNVLTILDKTIPKLYIRLINCAVIVTTFMITIMEIDPLRDSIVEFLGTTSTNLLNMPIIAYEAGGGSKEIRVTSNGLPTSPATVVNFAEGPLFVDKPTPITNLVGKYIKIFDKNSPGKKANYVLDFGIDNNPVTKFIRLAKTSASEISSANLGMSFAKFIEIFKQSLQNTTFDDTSLLGQLNALRDKNAKLTKAIQSIIDYLNNLNNNLDQYKR